MPSKKSYIEFAADIKKKYPAYKNIDDLQLAKDIVAKYPAYSEIVSFEQEKFDTSDLSLRNRPIDFSGSKLNQQPLTIQPMVGGTKQNYFDKQPKGINKAIQANQQQYLNNPQQQASAQYDQIQANPQQYVTPNPPDEQGNASAYDLAGDKEYMDNLFAAMPAQKQYQEWKKYKGRWNEHEAVQRFKTVDDNQKGLSRTAPVNWLEAISAGADAVMGGLSEFMHQNIEKPLYGWMWKNPNSRQIWGRLSDHFAAGQQYLSSAAGKENTVDNDGQIRQKDFVDYFKEGDWLSAMDDITTGALESAPTSAVAIGATMAGSPHAGLALIGAQVAGSRKRELDRYNPELTEFQKNLIAFGSGAIEAGSELLGDVPIGKMLSNLYRRGGTVVFDNVMKNSVDDIIKTTTKNLRNGSLLWKAPLGEGSEEVVSGVGNYLLDTAVGIQNFNFTDMMTDAAKQGVYGAVSGSGFGFMGTPGMVRNQKVAKALETLKSDYDQKKSELEQSLAGSGLEFNGEKIITLPLDQQEQVLTSVLSAENLTDKQKASIAGYMEAGNRLNTALVNTGLTNIELLRKKAAAVKEISERVNDKTGTIDAITIQGTADSEVYELKSGHLETDEEGNINTRKSDESVYYYTGNTNEDGTREVKIIPSQHISKIDRQQPQAVLTQKFTEIEQEEFGRSEFGEGMIVRLTDEQGNTPQLEDGSPLTGVINAVTENGFVVEMPDGSDSEIPFRVAAQTMEKVEATPTVENAEQEEQATPPEYQPGATATINGTTYVVRDKDDQGNYNITDADGNLIDRFTPQEMADMGFQVTLPNNPDAEHPIQEDDVAVTPEMTPEQQAEAEKQNFIATLPRISQGKKAGRVDTKKLTPDQAFRYTQIMEGTETAVKDIKEDIFAIDSSIRELNKKLQTTKGNAKIDIREDIRELNEQRGTLKTILDREMPGLEAAMKAEADKRAQIEAEVQAKNQALEEERKNRVLTDAERENLHNNIVTLIREHNELPANYTQKKRTVFNEISKKAQQLGYSVTVLPGGQFTVLDKDRKPIRTIAQRTPQEEIDAHPSLTDYAPEFQAFVQQLMQCMPETLDIPNTNIVVGVKDVQAGKKSIAANRLLDEIEKMFISGEIIIRATASTPEVVLSIDEYFQLFEPASEEEKQILDTIPDEILNEMFSDGEMTDEIANYLNDLYNETYKQINGSPAGESPSESIDRTSEEGISGQEETTAEPPSEQIASTYKNGDTVYYQGEQYVINGVSSDGNIYDLELNGKTVFEDVPGSELSQSEPITDNSQPEAKEVKQDPANFVIGEYELKNIIKGSPTPNFEDFQNKAVGSFIHLIEPNETITGRELANRIASTYDLHNQRNRVDFSAIWYMGDKEIKHTLNGVSVKGKHKGNVSTPEIKPEQPKLTGAKAEIQQIIDNYNDVGNITMNDVINDILSVAYDNDITAIQEAYKTYQEEVRQDKEEFGERGDREHMENDFMKVVEEYMNQSDKSKPTEESKTTTDKVSAAQAEADAALQDFLDAFNDLNSDNLGIVDNTAEKQAKMLVAGTKMIGAYTRLGIYKFAEILKQIQAKGIQITEDLLSALKKSYGAFAAENDIEQLDEIKTVRKFTLNDLQQNEQPTRSTEAIASETAAIETTSELVRSNAENVGSDKQRAGEVQEQAREEIKKVESLLFEVESKLEQLRLTDKTYSTDGIYADYPINVLAKGEIKKDLTKYIKAVAQITGFTHDTDKKGKTEIVNVNIAPAGGDATFFLWSKTNPDLGVYVSIPYDPDYSSGGGYDNYKVLNEGWRSQILFRVVNKADKYKGSNQYMKTDVTAKEMAETLLKAHNYRLKSLNVEPESAPEIQEPANSGAKITQKTTTEKPKEKAVEEIKELFNGSKKDLTPKQDKTSENVVSLNEQKFDKEHVIFGTIPKTNDNGNSKQRVLQGSNKRLSGTAQPDLFGGVETGERTGGSVGIQSNAVSGADAAEQQPTGRAGNILSGDAGLSDTTGRGRIGSREGVGTNAQGTERTGGTGILDTPALVPFNAEDNDTQSFNQSRKYDDNIAAIETLITLIKENRKATPDEKATLSNYVGFGGLKDIVLNPESSEGWKESNLKYRAQVKRINELAAEFDKVTGSSGSLSSIKGSILNAHFTSSSVIRSVYDGIQKLGFKGGRMLEPSAGIGNFITYAPERIKANSNITAVELDNLTGNILKYLHDDVNVKVTGIQDAQIPNNSQDLVISNVPFGNYKIFDKAFKGDKAEFQNRIHNYFFAKAIDMAREGGIIAFVTSKGVMDAAGNESLRKYLNDNSEFLGAVRLPNSAFKNNANTEVVTDIIFLKKNTTGSKNNPDFVSIKQVEATHKDGEKQMVNVNNYFVENPQNMLGNIVAGGLYSREDYTVENKTGYDLSKAIKNALPAGVYEKVNSKIGLQANDSQETIDAIKEGNIEVTGGRIVRKEEGQLVDISINEPEAKIQHYIRLRNALMNLIYSEYLGKPDSELTALRGQLNTEYDTFVKKYGKLAKNALKIAKQDADGFNVLSLEVADKKDGKADIFRQRTIQPIQNKLNAESVDEAIVISLYENASIDVERIAELLNITVPEVLQQAKGKIFEQPEGGFVTREEYLSGNVKAKLRQAQEAVDKGFTEFAYNVEQLMDVIPADIPAMHIEARLGSRWIPQEVYTEFAQHLFNTPSAKVIYQRSIDAYSNNGRIETVEAHSKWGTARRNGSDILLDALHINPPKIFDTIKEFGQEKRVLNQDETKKAVEKYEEIRAEFENWVYKAEERRTLLARIYNEKYNTTVKRTYNGDHLNIAGINGVTLRKHQKDAIWMLLQNNGGIIDHLVGAGKTYVMVAGTMEMKRTGIAKKPMIIALKSTIPQIVETYRKAYPMAKILAPLEKDFTKDNRRKLFSQIANNEWDVIIMSHENYGKIPHEADIQRDFLRAEMQEIEDERGELEAAGEKHALKGLEIRLKNLEARLEKISDIDKDNSLTFEQMGIDHIMVDESHQFKNLSYVTKQRGVAGLSKAEGSKRAFNLFIGIRYLQQKYGADKGTTFLSGTPIINSMVEMYLLLKYLRPGKMAELGFNSFDAWATTFASPNSDIEFTVTGDFKSKTRFREFFNVHELSMLYTEIADIRTDANTPLDKPKMKGGGYSVVEIKMSDDQKEYGQRLMEFARTKDGHHIGMTLTKNQETAAMLLATNLSSKMAIDMRLIDPSYSYDPNGKIAKLVDNVERIYNETAEHKGTQLIFSDLGTPKNKTNKTAGLRDYMEDEMGVNLDTLNEIFGNPDEAGYKYPSINSIREKLSTILELSDSEIDNIISESEQSEGAFNVYAEVRKRLVEKGIPEEQVVFIHDYNSQRAKEKLFKQVQNGEIRIVLGSTQKLGTGVNVQQRVVAVHHLDVPWTPASMEQRNGRALRQGNWVAKNHYGNELPIYAYATERTLDAYKYQLLQTKQRFLDQVKSGDVEERTVRESDGDSESGVGYAELVAMLSGNTDILLKAKLETLVQKLTKSKRNYLSEIYEAQDKKQKLEERIPVIEGNIAKTTENIQTITNATKYDAEGKMEVADINGEKLVVKNDKGKVVPTERIDYGKRAVEIAKAKLDGASYGNIVKLFSQNGFDFYGSKRIESTMNNGKFGEVEKRYITLRAKNGVEYNVTYSETPGVLLNNIQKAVQGIPAILSTQQSILDKANKDIIAYNEIISKGTDWEKEPELTKALNELKEVTKRLDDISTKDQPQPPTDGEPLTDDKIRIGDLTFTIGNESFVTMAEAKNKAGEDVAVVRINSQLSNEDYTRRVKPSIGHYFGEWNRSNKVIMFNNIKQAENFKITIENEFKKENREYEAPQLHTGTTLTPAPHQKVKELVKQLLKTGLAKEVRMITPEEIAGILEGNEQLHAVYHGSPHSFDQFSLDYIGTGEGAQAYGWGLYFTDKKEIAEDYANNLRKGNNLSYDERTDYKLNGKQLPKKKANFIRTYFNSNTGSVSEMKERALFWKNEFKRDVENGYYDKYPKHIYEKDLFLDKLSDEIINADSFEVIDNTNQPTNIYSVELHEGKDPGEYVYLRWDKPFREQSQAAKDAFSKGFSINSFDEDYETVGDFYKKRASIKGAESVSKELLALGIDGIQYPANFTTGKANETDFNYVVFDPSAITIKEKVQFMRTPTGTIYGFVKNGVVYLNSSTPNLNTPIHEFGHLWIDAIEGSELYDRGAELVKDTPYWERVNADPNYKNLSETGRTKEAMAMAIGDKGEAVKRDIGLFARIKTWINDVWKRIGAQFGIQNLTPEQIQNLTFTDFVDVAVSELLSGENLAENELSNPLRRLDKAYKAKEYEPIKNISIAEELSKYDIPQPDDVWKDSDTIFAPQRTVFNEDNIAASLYQHGAKGIRDIHKQYQNLLKLEGREYGYPYVDTSSAMYFRDLINPEIDNYVAMLQQVKHLSTPAAQEIINELIEDARQSKDYYNRLAAGEDVWRTEKSPRYQIVGEEVARNVVNSKKEANFESPSNGLDDIRQLAERFDSAADKNKKYEAALELAEALNTTFGKTYDEYAYAVVRTAEDMRSILDRDFGNTLSEKEKQNTCTGLGAYFNNRTYFIAENIDNSNNFIRTWAHENAHRETEHNFSEDFLASIYEAFEASEQGIVDKLLPSRYADLSTAEKVDEMLSFTIEEMFTQAAMQGHSLTSKQIDRMTSMGNIDFKGALSTIYNNIINVQNNERPGKDRNDRRLHISEGRNEGKPDTRAIQGNRDPGRAYRRDSEEQEGSGRGIHAIGDHQRGDGRADVVPEFTGDIAAYSGETNRRNLTVRSRLSDENLSSNLRNARRQLFNAGWELDQARKAKEAGTMSDSTFEKKQAELTSVITRLKKELEDYEQQMQLTVVESTPEDIDINWTVVESTPEDIDIDEPKPTRTPGQSISDYATALADWNYRQKLVRAMAATTREVTGGLPADTAPENNEIEMDLLRLELDQRLGGFFGRLAEGWQDNIRSVRIFLDLLREKGTRVSDFNDFYMQYTAIQGKNDAHLKDFGKRYMDTINANLKSILKFTSYEYRDLENYVFLKHGIERNEYMRAEAKRIAEAEGKKFRERDDYSGIYAIAAELWAKQNGVSFNPKKKGEVEKIQADPEFVKERDKVIAEYIAEFEKTVNEAGIPGAVKGETLTIDGFWAAINAATHYSLDRLVSGGIESKKEVDDLKARYQYYVPLRGHEVEAEKVWQYEAPDNKNVVSKAIMQASGRATRAEHPFAYIIQMAQTSINKANRNQLNQTILRLARQDKSGLMSVSEAWYVLTGTDPESGKEIWTETEPEFSEDHEIRAGEISAWNEKMVELEKEGKARRFRKGLNIGGLFIKPKQRRQHAISVYEGGVLYQVYINGNPRVSQAVNELNNRTLDNYSIVKVIRSTTRFISSMITSRSPQFMLTNGARDLAFASSILPSKEGGRYTAQFLKNYPVVMAILANDATFDAGNKNNQYKKYLREFEMNGGETGYSHLLELQDIEKKLRKDHKGKNYLNPITDVETLVEVIDAGNKVIENSTRLAVYITSRESGRSIERSVSDSKEVTLNFNRRGSGIMGAAEIQSLFMFVNAGVQALANFGRVYKMHPVKMSATIGAYAAVGFMLPMIIAMIGGDDDEKEYMNMTDWERQTNLCLPTGGGFAKIPLPQEMRVFFKLGDEVYKLYTGRTEAVETAMATLMSAADMIPISPLGTIAAGEVNDFGDLQRAISPDALRGVAELATNKNFMGGQIVDKYKADKEGLPGYQKARLNRVGDPRAPESIYGFTRWLDKLTGGDGVQKGKISLNPDIVNHLAKSYLGGMYSLAAEGEKSFTRRFYTSNADIEEKNTTVKDYYKRTDEADEFIRKAKGYAAQLASGEISEQEYNKKVSDKALERASTIHSYDKVITKIERLLKTGELSADDERYYKNMSDSLKREVIRIQ